MTEPTIEAVVIVMVEEMRAGIICAGCGAVKARGVLLCVECLRRFLEVMRACND